MDEKRIDLRDALRELAAEQSDDAGPHVGLERLIAYRQGMLPVAEREAVQEHLSLCAECTGLLRELQDFEAASAADVPGPEPLQEEAWESLLRSLPPPPPLRSIPRFLYGLAATLLLAVFGLSAWAVVTAQREHGRLALLERRLEEREEALAAAQRRIQALEKEKVERRPVVKELETRVAELTSELEKLRQATPAPEGHDRLASIGLSVAPQFVLRGQEPSFLRGGGAVNPVRIASRADRFTVALSLADHAVYEEYRFELLDRDGKVLWTGRRPGKSLLGDAGTSVSINGLGPGLFRLRIEGLHPHRSELLAEYLLEVQRQR